MTKKNISKDSLFRKKNTYKKSKKRTIKMAILQRSILSVLEKNKSPHSKNPYWIARNILFIGELNTKFRRFWPTKYIETIYWKKTRFRTFPRKNQYTYNKKHTGIIRSSLYENIIFDIYYECKRFLSSETTESYFENVVENIRKNLMSKPPTK